jgi:ABC-type amino acid transport substrate-binding protein
LWVAAGTALVLVAAAVVALALNGWPRLTFMGKQPQPTEKQPPPSFASVVDKVARAGKIVIGVRGDLPGVGLQNGDGFQGFEVEIAKRIAAGLGAKETTFVRVGRDTRAAALAEGRVDLVIATYSIDKSETTFAGPYYVAHRDVLVRAGSGIDSLDDLDGKQICSLNSPSVGDVQDKVEVEPVAAGNFADCMDKLKSDKVDAIPGEDLILAGFANRENMRYKVIGAKLNNERYAVGIRNGDAKTCKAVNGIIAGFYRDGTMKSLLDSHFGKVDFTWELKQPAMETCG